MALVACLLAPSPATAAGPGAYVARRFDVNATVLAGGNLDVTDSITFEFQSGTFQKVGRELLSSKTDGIDIVDAWMDGNRVTRGEGPGHIVVRGSNRINVEWQFAPTGPSTHTFQLRYLVRGVAFRDGSRDVVRWKLLPNEHRYTIDASRATIAAPVTPAGAPIVETRRAGRVSSSQSGSAVQIVASTIGTNGWVIAEIHYPAASLIKTSPEWQRRADTATSLVPRWEMAAGAIFIAGLLVLLVIRQGYDSPGFDGVERATATEPPEALPVALAAALASKGRASGYASVAALLDLADRGVLTVRELPRRFGVRNYELSQVPGKHELDGHEAEALSIAFADGGDDVAMSRARDRLARDGRRFSKAVNNDLAERGLFDPSRKAIRDRLTAVSLGMIFSAVLSACGLAALIPRYQGWPLLPALALMVCGIIGVVMAASSSPLSDAGLMQGARWRGFRGHLKGVAAARDVDGAAAVGPRWIVYAIALGLGYQWARYLKKHPGVAPSWFATTDDDPGGAFAAFVGSGAASASAGHGR